MDMNYGGGGYNAPPGGGAYYPQRSPLEEARLRERKALFRSCSKLGALLLIYALLQYVFKYVYYGVVATVSSGSFNLMPWQSLKYLREHQEIVSGSSFSMGGNLSIVFFSMLILMLIARFAMKIDLSEMAKPEKRHFKQAVKWFPLCMLLNIAVSYVITILENYLSSVGVNMPDVDFTIQEPSNLAITLQFVYVILIGPLAEELLYRGLVLSLLKPYGNWLAVLFSSLIFGLMHGNVPQAASAFASAMVAGMIAIKCNSVIPTLIIHIMNNTIASYTDFAEVIGWPYASEILMAIEIIVLFAGLFVLFVYGWQIVSTKDGKFALTFGQRVTAVFTNILMLVYFLYELYSFFTSFINAN